MFNNVLPKKKRAVYKNVERYREAGQARDDTIRLTSFSFATINSPDDGHMADRNM